LPELKKVIVFYKNQVVMEDSLEKSLARIFPPEEDKTQEPSGTPQAPETQQPPIEGEIGDSSLVQLIRRANDVFNQAQEAQRAGNWALYGEKINELETILQKLGDLNID
jgi:uncharacterized membrane protein (UPF0182 family)